MIRAFASFPLHRCGAQQKMAFRCNIHIPSIIISSASKTQTSVFPVLTQSFLAARNFYSKYEVTADGLSSDSSTTRKIVESKRNVRWDQMLAQFLQYREDHGDTLVPMEYDLNPRLGTWGKWTQQSYIMRVIVSALMLMHLPMFTCLIVHKYQLIHNVKTSSFISKEKNHF